MATQRYQADFLLRSDPNARTLVINTYAASTNTHKEMIIFLDIPNAVLFARVCWSSAGLKLNAAPLG